MTLHQYLGYVRQRLVKVGINTPELDAIVLLEHATGKSREWLYARANTATENILTRQDLHAFEELIKRRVRSEPIAYIVGEKEFHGLPFMVTPDVMIPRPETEALVNHTLKHAPGNARILDVGTGSGALAVAIKHSRSSLHVTASDVSAKALTIARGNALKNETFLQFRKSDLFSRVTGTFDVIIANLPYLKPDAELTRDAEQEPKLALDGGDKDGLGVYRRFLQDAPGYLNSGGIIILESDPWQHQKLAGIADSHELYPCTSDNLMLVFTNTASN